MICISKLTSFGVGLLVMTANSAAQADNEAAEPTQARTQSAYAARSMDLTPPQITRIFTIQQIDMILARAVDPDLEHVEVEATRIGDLPLQDNSASAPRVVFDTVVRWLAPYPTTLAAQVNAAPDFTDSYRPVPVSMSSYHASFAPPYSQR
jgi:hypothetical protein